jgi:hypothetical protein
MQAKMWESEKVVKLVTQLLKHFDNANRGRTTYINTYRLSKYIAEMSEKQRVMISSKTIKAIYEVLTCMTERLGGWYIKGNHSWVFALPHEALSQLSDGELAGMILRCMEHGSTNE